MKAASSFNLVVPPFGTVDPNGIVLFRFAKLASNGFETESTFFITDAPIVLLATSYCNTPKVSGLVVGFADARRFVFDTKIGFTRLLSLIVTTWES